MSNVKLGLEKALKSRGKSMYALAKETKVAYSTIFRMTTGDVKTVDLDVLKKVCKNLNCGVSEIIPIKPH
jgi:DNA-binding Xre family transcriptional regulator